MWGSVHRNSGNCLRMSDFSIFDSTSRTPYSQFNLDNSCFIDQLIQNCRLERPDDIVGYKERIYQVVEAKVVSHLDGYQSRDYPIKLKQLQADLASTFPLDQGDRVKIISILAT